MTRAEIDYERTALAMDYAETHSPRVAWFMADCAVVWMWIRRTL